MGIDHPEVMISLAPRSLVRVMSVVFTMPVTSPLYLRLRKDCGRAANGRSGVNSDILCEAAGQTYPLAEAARAQADLERNRPDDGERAAASVGRVL